MPTLDSPHELGPDSSPERQPTLEESEAHYHALSRDWQWMAANHDHFVAILGRVILGSAPDRAEVDALVREYFGEATGAVFIAYVEADAATLQREADAEQAQKENRATYELARRDPQLVAKHRGRWVIFVGGRIVGDAESWESGRESAELQFPGYVALVASLEPLSTIRGSN